MPSDPSDLPHPAVAPPGLKGLVVADTSIGDVRGAEGFFHYRQYSAVELAESRSFEDVWYLLLLGHLPDAAQRRAFHAATAPRRALPPTVLAALPAIAASGAAPLSQLATGLALTGGALGLRPMLDIDEAARLDDALALVSVVPTLVAALHRLGLGLTPIEPDPSLGHAADYLRMLTGEVPAAEEARAVDAYLVLTADHGFNASTFTGRVIASTGADLGACVVGASVLCPARCTAVPRAGPSTCSTRSAIRPGLPRSSRPMSPPASASWASATPSTSARTPAPCCCGSWPPSSAERRPSSPAPPRRPWSRRSPASSPTATCAPTWSSSPAW